MLRPSKLMLLIGLVVILVKTYVETFKTNVIDRTSCNTSENVC